MISEMNTQIKFLLNLKSANNSLTLTSTKCASKLKPQGHRFVESMT